MAVAAGAASGGDDDWGLTGGGLDLSGLYQPVEPPPLEPAPAEPAPGLGAAGRADDGPAFGEIGHTRYSFHLGLGVGLEQEDSTDPNFTASVSRFLAPDLEVVGEVGAWYFFQDGDDAFGVSASFAFRYHVVERETWSVFFEAGIGPLVSTDLVPDMGTGFNFMPRAGLGATWALGDGSGARAVAGLRWHHISNARISGDQDNPDRDGVYAWVGLSFPF